MRELTADEREIVAGGWYSAEYEEDDYFLSGRRYGITIINGEVIVGGKKKIPITLPMLGFWDTGGAGSANGGGGGTADSDDTPDVRDVTCVVAKPDVTDLKDIFQKAVDLHNHEMKKINWEMEWGALIYTLNGDPSTVYATEIVGGKDRDHIPIKEWERAASMLPANAVIVGTWHSHPGNLLGGNGHLPSDYRGDWGFHTNLLNGKIGDYPVLLRVDPNALMLITDKITGKTWVYDKTDYNREGGIAPGSKTCEVNRRG